jgi:hypothetical protein
MFSLLGYTGDGAWNSEDGEEEAFRHDGGREMAGAVSDVCPRLLCAREHSGKNKN